ncbi:zinc finger protein 28 [Lasius niger]|uniref:Zinc finger protein 28 n=1 Tax=Lasius niger TaxID=67767 RepID=A0A0J7NRL4_LASNI|nr:zinc finger protein 28 [Lasius niger]
MERCNVNWNVRGDNNDSTTYHVHKRYVCPFCKKVYVPKNLLKKHIQLGCKMNPRNTQFACTFCPYKSMYKANMERHVRNVHNTGGLKFRCELCNFRTLSWHTYCSVRKEIGEQDSAKGNTLHQQKRDAIVRKKIYVCALCAKGYTSTIKLLSHQKFECLKQYLLERQSFNTGKTSSIFRLRIDARRTCFCLKLPVAPINRSDIDVSALLRPNKTYVGDALYQQQGSIVGETREKTHVCADCGKSYAAKRSLWRHRKFECVNAKPKFSCEKCSYKSPHKWRMDTHRKMVHGFFPTG